MLGFLLFVVEGSQENPGIRTREYRLRPVVRHPDEPRHTVGEPDSDVTGAARDPCLL